MATGAVKFALAVGLPVKGLIRKTAFDHFCGGETIEEASETTRKLGNFHVGTILDYSVARALLSLLDVALDTLAVTGTRRPRTEAGSLELSILSLPSLSPSPAPLVALTFALYTRRTVGLDAVGLGAAILRCRNDDFYFGRN